MIRSLAILALLDATSAHRCATEGAKHCWESSPVSGDKISHLILNPHHHEDIDHHHRNSRVDREHDDDKSEGYLDEEYSEGHRGDDFSECAVSHSRNWNWFHFEVDTPGPRQSQNRLRFKIDHKRVYVGDLEWAVIGPFHSYEEMHEHCGILDDDKLKGCSKEVGRRKLYDETGKPGGPRVGCNPSKGASEACREVSITGVKPGEIYALLVGSTYEDARLSIHLLGDLKSGSTKGYTMPGHDAKNIKQCVECDQFWDGASLDDLGTPVCMRRAEASLDMFPSNFQQYWDGDDWNYTPEDFDGHIDILKRIYKKSELPLGHHGEHDDPRVYPMDPWDGENGPGHDGTMEWAPGHRAYDRTQLKYYGRPITGEDPRSAGPGPTRRQLSVDEEEDDEPLYLDLDEYWVHECRPADLSGLPPNSKYFDRKHPFEHEHDHYHDEVDEEEGHHHHGEIDEEYHDHHHPYMAGIKDIFDLEHTLNAIHKPACPKDHYLVLADHHEDPLPDCPCDDFPDAHGNFDYFHEIEGHTMCMKIEVLKMPRHHDNIKLVCHEPHAEYPHVGVEDGGTRTWAGCRSDQIACKFRGLRRPAPTRPN